MMKLTKLDIVRRQLETAVKLYFNDGDPVSIHTLAAACNEMLTVLNKQKGGRLFLLSEEFVSKPEYKKMIRKTLTEAKNFFKHTGRDSEATFEFSPAGNDFWLFDCCERYQMLTGEKNPHFIIFRAWFRSLHPDIFESPSEQWIKQEFGDRKLDFYSKMLSTSAMLQ